MIFTLLMIYDWWLNKLWTTHCLITRVWLFYWCARIYKIDDKESRSIQYPVPGLKGVLQGSVFRPILFNIFLNDIFFAFKGIDKCNFADGITPYVCDSNVKLVLEPIEHNSELTVAWFEMNYVKLNTDKCHLLVSGNKNGQM